MAPPRRPLVAGASIACVVLCGTLGWLWFRSVVPRTTPLVRPVEDLAPLVALTSPATGRLWFLGDTGVGSTTEVPGQGEPPVSRTVSLHVFNPGDEPAQVVVRCYRGNVGPAALEFGVGAGALGTLNLSTTNGLPVDDLCWLVVEADRPVLPQARIATSRPWDPVPDTLVMLMPLAGPLDERHRDWIYPDGFQGGTHAWVEDEVVTVLNPWATSTDVELHYRFRDGRPSLAETVVVPPERVTAVAVGGRSSTTAAVSGDYAILISAHRPIVSQQTRRARWRGETRTTGARALMPLTATDALRARDWWFAGGWVRDPGFLPRDGYTERTWHLLFTYGLDDNARVPVSVETFHDAREPGAGGTIEAPVGRSDLQWLHSAPWLDAEALESPFGLRLEPRRPVAPSLTFAEFEPWSQVMPGAMGATTLVAGPLDDTHERWWLGVAEHGGRDDRAIEYEAAWQLLNPGDVPVRVTLTFAGLPDGVRHHELVVAPHRVVRVTGNEVAGLPVGVAFSVMAEATAPIVAYAWLRVGVRGVEGTRALVSHHGLPWR